MTALGMLARLFAPTQAPTVNVEHMSEDAEPMAGACQCGASKSQRIDATPFGPKRTPICGACGAAVGAR